MSKTTLKLADTMEDLEYAEELASAFNLQLDKTPAEDGFESFSSTTTTSAEVTIKPISIESLYEVWQSVPPRKPTPPAIVIIACKKHRKQIEKQLNALPSTLSTQTVGGFTYSPALLSAMSAQVYLYTKPYAKKVRVMELNMDVFKWRGDVLQRDGLLRI